MNKEKTAKTINMGDLYSSYGMFIIFAIIFFAASVTTDAFLSVNNILNVLRLMCITGISAYGMTFVLTLGEIDLSIGSIMALGGCISAMVWAVTGNPCIRVWCRSAYRCDLRSNIWSNYSSNFDTNINYNFCNADNSKRNCIFDYRWTTCCMEWEKALKF